MTLPFISLNIHAHFFQTRGLHLSCLLALYTLNFSEGLHPSPKQNTGDVPAKAEGFESDPWR